MNFLTSPASSVAAKFLFLALYSGLILWILVNVVPGVIHRVRFVLGRMFWPLVGVIALTAVWRYLA